MPPTTVPERMETMQAAASPAPSRLMSPLGYFVVVVVMIITAVVVGWAIVSFHDTAPVAPIQEAYEEIDLGQVARDLAPDSVNLAREQFMLRVILVLNPKYRNVAEMKSLVERRKNLLKDIVWGEIIYPKSDQDLRKPAILESLKSEIRQRLNAELGSSKEGQEMIARVIFPESRLPARR